MPPIYLDYNASTPVDQAVAAVMRPFLEQAFGNPSSGHWASTPAKAALEQARGQVAGLIGAAPDEIVFTSGGSEANNLAIKGTFFAPGIRLSLRPADFSSASAPRLLVSRWTQQAASIRTTSGALSRRRRP